MNTLKTRSHGFTLIELMVVVVIIAIIAAIAVPAYTSFLRTSAEAKCIEETGHLELDVEDWRQRNYNNAQGYQAEGYNKSGNEYLVPKGSTASDYACKVKLVSLDNKQLTNTAADASGWHMYAVPNTSSRATKLADGVYRNSQNAACRIHASGTSLSMPSDITGTSYCDQTNATKL